jgi:hypothetical protein
LSKAFGAVEFEDENKGNGLIERSGRLRFQHVLNFEAKAQLTKAETGNHENNQRLQHMRQTFKENAKMVPPSGYNARH